MLRRLLPVFAILVASCTQVPQPEPTVLGGSVGDAGASTTCDAAPFGGPRVLLYGRQIEWDHASNPVAQAALGNAGIARGWLVLQTNDAKAFTPTFLRDYDVVVFVITSGNTLSDEQRAAFQGFINQGGGYAGVHSASFTDIDWPFMRTLVGAKFYGHPAIQELDLMVDDPADPIVNHVPRPWRRSDEWYTFDGRPEEDPSLHILLSLVEPPGYPGAGFPPALAVGKHPVAWRHEVAGGRAFYTALGHTVESWSEPAMVEHMARGIEWVADPSRRRRACAR